MRNWTSLSIRKLKYKADQTAGTQLLAKAKKKRTPQGAFDLLVYIGAWSTHENIWLLRSGFPIHFETTHTDGTDGVDGHRDGDGQEGVESTMLDEPVGTDAAVDPDALLNVRQDFTDHKIYTIDGADAFEIDDGLSVEDLGDGRYRYWIHIADADRCAPPGSPAYEEARGRVVTLYLPLRTVPVFPKELSDKMSLLGSTTNDCFALSMGIELDDDGAIIPSSIVMTPTKVSVAYRLTYDDVDDMLEEGVGYNEEWQLGCLLDAAEDRRKYRMRKGSVEGMVPVPIPKQSVAAFDDGDRIEITIESDQSLGQSKMTAPICPAPGLKSTVAWSSSSRLLVTEMMIMAGEALGMWQQHEMKKLQYITSTTEADHDDDDTAAPGQSMLPILNSLSLPFRSQPAPGEYKLL